MKVVIEMTADESIKLTPLARRLYEDSEAAAERRHGKQAYKTMSWDARDERCRRHWIRVAAVQNYVFERLEAYG